jgi:hypothetical protein
MPELPAIGRPLSRRNWRASAARNSEEGASGTEIEPPLVVSGKSGAGTKPTVTVTGEVERFPSVRSDWKRAPVAPTRSRTTGRYFAEERVDAR